MFANIFTFTSLTRFVSNIFRIFSVYKNPKIQILVFFFKFFKRLEKWYKVLDVYLVLHRHWY